MSNAPLFALLGFATTALVWPVLRGWSRTGVFPVVFSRRGAPLQRLIGAAMGAAILSFFAILGARAAAGPEVLGEWPAPQGVTFSGWLMVAVGWGITLVAQRNMDASWRIGIDDRPTALVTRGLFGVVRNPVFSGMLLALVGLCLVAPSVWLLAVTLACAVLIRLQVGGEERHLAALHGSAYLEYAAKVGRFIPGLGVGVRYGSGQ